YVIPADGGPDFSVRTESTEFYLPGFSMPTTDNQRNLILVPLVLEETGIAWIKIAEGPSGDFPHIILERDTRPGTNDGTLLVTRLDRDYSGKTPYTCPWRLILIGPDRNSVALPAAITDLTR